ncbi:alpha/beta hydrolase [Acinetobacter puyangensis]|uniref:2-hydroxymuconate-semialdehyde hydrolase n=1 Tax=Acinetobacter puyangensis TaxID=1096779 RepID=A0A240E2X5_9GAMM|nr:alpha/beta hydrolase [Acinetobacter puyangensis]SNX43134.1 2-hydroxymuconate-semialdehyde hydrolase [Acinetobacter puyangensis]
MCAMEIPNYKTDPFFGLQDQWIETATDELTHYHELGTGTPLLFLHGSGTGVSAAANWWLNLQHLSQIGHCYAIDSIGYGQTVVADHTAYGIKQWVEHAIRFLDAKGIEKTWVIGNSLGGWLAFQMALDYPERLLGIISMGTGGAKQTAALKQHANPELSLAGIRKTLEMFVVDKTLITDELVQVRLEAAKNDYANARLLDVVAARDRDRFEFPLDFEKMKQIDLPVLLIHGVQDVVIPVSRTWDILNTVSTADAHIFNQCGHWSQVEKSEEFNLIVSNYLNQHIS